MCGYWFVFCNARPHVFHRAVQFAFWAVLCFWLARLYWPLAAAGHPDCIAPKIIDFRLRPPPNKV